MNTNFMPALASITPKPCNEMHRKVGKRAFPRLYIIYANIKTHSGKHMCAHQQAQKNTQTHTAMTCSFRFTSTSSAWRVMADTHRHTSTQLAEGVWIIHLPCLYALDRKKERRERKRDGGGEKQKWQWCKNVFQIHNMFSCDNHHLNSIKTNTSEPLESKILASPCDTRMFRLFVLCCINSRFLLFSPSVSLYGGPQLDGGIASSIFLLLRCPLVHSSKSSFLRRWGIQGNGNAYLHMHTHTCKCVSFDLGGF